MLSDYTQGMMGYANNGVYVDSLNLVKMSE